MASRLRKWTTGHSLRDYAQGRGWQIVAEYVDEASATNMRDRTAWRDMMAHVRKGGIDLVLMTKLDRASPSAKDTYDNLAYLDQHQVGFIATTQPTDLIGLGFPLASSRDAIPVPPPEQHSPGRRHPWGTAKGPGSKTQAPVCTLGK